MTPLSSKNDQKQRLLCIFDDLIRINEVFGQEDQIVSYVEAFCHKNGASCKTDSFGNLICTYPGTGEPVLLNTHLDIPESAPNVEYTVSGDIVQSTGKSILGADPKSGLAVLLELLRFLNENKIATRPIEFVFTLGEEAGLVGSRNLDYSLLSSKMGLVIDEDGPVSNIVIGAVGMYSIDVKVIGKTAHSRDWNEGINAIHHVAKIISALKQGEIEDGVTFNIGLLQAGSAVNSVAGAAQFQAEFRSFDMEKMSQTVQKTEQKILRYAKKYNLTIDFHSETHFESYILEQDHPLFDRLLDTFNANGISGNFYKTFGGSDSNIFNANGIRTVAVGSGYYRAHQYTEYINLQEMADLLMFLAKFVEQ